MISNLAIFAGVAIQHASASGSCIVDYLDTKLVCIANIKLFKIKFYLVFVVI